MGGEDNMPAEDADSEEVVVNPTAAAIEAELVELRGMDEVISFPRAEIYRHTLTRGAQAGVLGSWLATPPVALWKGYRSTEVLKITTRMSAVGALLGATILAFGTERKLESATPYTLYDRAYRLRHNRGQNTLDHLSYTLGVAGLFAGTVVMNKGLLGGLTLGAAGLGSGVVAYGVLKVSNLLDTEG